MKKIAFILSAAALLAGACDKKAQEEAEEARAGTVNIEKGVVPEMWNSDVDLTPIPQNVANNVSSNASAAETKDEGQAQDGQAIQEEKPDNGSSQAAPAPEVRESKPEASKSTAPEPQKEQSKSDQAEG